MPENGSLISAEDVQARLRETPFQPFRIRAIEGAEYDIRLPDLVMVGRHDLMIGFPDPVTPTIYNGVTRVTLENILFIENLTPGVGVGKRHQ